MLPLYGHLQDGWLLDRHKVEAYLTAAERMYKPNPYHNNTHAADVTQTAGVIFTSLDQHLRRRSNSDDCFCNGTTANGAVSNNSAADSKQQHNSSSSVGAGLSKLERFAIILASAVHDLGHPGVNNPFLIRTHNRQALIYNDKSVNENMHCSLAFQLALDNPDVNVFERFSQAEYEQVRKLVCEMILATDMDVHFALLKRFEDAVAAQPDVRQWRSLEQRSLIFQMLVHLADLANPSRPWHLALKWAEWVVTEFLEQGVKEAEAGIPVSDMCNKDKVCMPAAQLFFIERFMQPTLDAFKPAAPSFHSMATPWLEDTKARWGIFKEAGVRMPHHGYPQLAPPAAGQQQKPWAVLGAGHGSSSGASAQLSNEQQQ
eukprot:GHRR01010206.1.p1 GENE.GHRR01010206.1~~GHRR01010206.1.p1  ORF type:complete len:373 (+),score=154.98 GHRR01010206.1:405-1523(+)